MISHLSPSSDGRMLGPCVRFLRSEKQLNSGLILMENGHLECWPPVAGHRWVAFGLCASAARRLCAAWRRTAPQGGARALPKVRRDARKGDWRPQWVQVCRTREQGGVHSARALVVLKCV